MKLFIILPLFLVFVLHSSWAATIKLAWSPNTEPDLMGYRVYLGTQSRVYTQTLDVGNVLTTTVNNLTGGTFYFLALGAYNTAGQESVLSSEVSAFPSSPTPTPPATPTATVTATASATATATFTPRPTATATASATVTATATVTPTATATATAPQALTISGNVNYCSGQPLTGAVVILTGTVSRVTGTDAQGNYTFTTLPYGGSYQVYATKASLAPGSSGINTVDVIAIQEQYLGRISLSDCQLAACDVNENGNVNTLDSVAVQSFVVALPTGYEDTGSYKFTPVLRSYPGMVSDQTNQDYDALVFGDVLEPYVEP